METIIITKNGNESILGTMTFRVLMNRKKLDNKGCKTYADALIRLDVLKSIFKYTLFEIVVELIP